MASRRSWSLSYPEFSLGFGDMGHHSGDNENVGYSISHSQSRSSQDSHVVDDVAKEMAYQVGHPQPMNVESQGGQNVNLQNVFKLVRQQYGALGGQSEGHMQSSESGAYSTGSGLSMSQSASWTTANLTVSEQYGEFLNHQGSLSGYIDSAQQSDALKYQQTTQSHTSAMSQQDYGTQKDSSQYRELQNKQQFQQQGFSSRQESARMGEDETMNQLSVLTQADGTGAGGESQTDVIQQQKELIEKQLIAGNTDPNTMIQLGEMHRKLCQLQRKLQQEEKPMFAQQSTTTKRNVKKGQSAGVKGGQVKTVVVSQPSGAYRKQSQPSQYQLTHWQQNQQVDHGEKQTAVPVYNYEHHGYQQHEQYTDITPQMGRQWPDSEQNQGGRSSDETHRSQRKRPPSPYGAGKQLSLDTREEIITEKVKRRRMSTDFVTSSHHKYLDSPEEELYFDDRYRAVHSPRRDTDRSVHSPRRDTARSVHSPRRDTGRSVHSPWRDTTRPRKQSYRRERDRERDRARPREKHASKKDAKIIDQSKKVQARTSSHEQQSRDVRIVTYKDTVDRSVDRYDRDWRPEDEAWTTQPVDIPVYVDSDYEIEEALRMKEELEIKIMSGRLDQEMEQTYKDMYFELLDQINDLEAKRCQKNIIIRVERSRSPDEYFYEYKDENKHDRDSYKPNSKRGDDDQRRSRRFADRRHAENRRKEGPSPQRTHHSSSRDSRSTETLSRHSNERKTERRGKRHRSISPVSRKSSIKDDSGHRRSKRTIEVRDESRHEKSSTSRSDSSKHYQGAMSSSRRHAAKVSASNTGPANTTTPRMRYKHSKGKLPEKVSINVKPPQPRPPKVQTPVTGQSVVQTPASGQSPMQIPAISHSPKIAPKPANVSYQTSVSMNYQHKPGAPPTSRRYQNYARGQPVAKSQIRSLPKKPACDKEAKRRRIEGEAHQTQQQTSPRNRNNLRVIRQTKPKRKPPVKQVVTTDSKSVLIDVVSAGGKKAKDGQKATDSNAGPATGQGQGQRKANGKRKTLLSSKAGNMTDVMIILKPNVEERLKKVFSYNHLYKKFCLFCCEKVPENVNQPTHLELPKHKDMQIVLERIARLWQVIKDFGKREKESRDNVLMKAQAIEEKLKNTKAGSNHCHICEIDIPETKEGFENHVNAVYHQILHYMFEIVAKVKTAVLNKDMDTIENLLQKEKEMMSGKKNGGTFCHLCGLDTGNEKDYASHVESSSHLIRVVCKSIIEDALQHLIKSTLVINLKRIPASEQQRKSNAETEDTCTPVLEKNKNGQKATEEKTERTSSEKEPTSQKKDDDAEMSKTELQDLEKTQETAKETKKPEGFSAQQSAVSVNIIPIDQFSNMSVKERLRKTFAYHLGDRYCLVCCAKIPERTKPMTHVNTYEHKGWCKLLEEMHSGQGEHEQDRSQNELLATETKTDPAIEEFLKMPVRERVQKTFAYRLGERYCLVCCEKIPENITLHVTSNEHKKQLESLEQQDKSQKELQRDRSETELKAFSEMKSDPVVEEPSPILTMSIEERLKTIFIDQHGHQYCLICCENFIESPTEDTPEKHVISIRHRCMQKSMILVSEMGKIIQALSKGTEKEKALSRAAVVEKKFKTSQGGVSKKNTLCCLCNMTFPVRQAYETHLRTVGHVEVKEAYEAVVTVKTAVETENMSPVEQLVQTYEEVLSASDEQETWFCLLCKFECGQKIAYEQHVAMSKHHVIKKVCKETVLKSLRQYCSDANSPPNETKTEADGSEVETESKVSDGKSEPVKAKEETLSHRTSDRPAKHPQAEQVISEPQVTQPATGNAGQPVKGQIDQPATGNAGQSVKSQTDQPATGNAGQPVKGQTDQPATGNAGQPVKGQTDQPATGNAGQPVKKKSGQPVVGSNKAPSAVAKAINAEPTKAVVLESLPSLSLENRLKKTFTYNLGERYCLICFEKLPEKIKPVEHVTLLKHKEMHHMLDRVSKMAEIILSLSETSKKETAIAKATQLEKKLCFAESRTDYHCAACNETSSGKQAYEVHLKSISHEQIQDASKAVIKMKNACQQNDVASVISLQQEYDERLSLRVDKERPWYCSVCDLDNEDKMMHEMHMSLSRHHVIRTVCKESILQAIRQYWKVYRLDFTQEGARKRYEDEVAAVFENTMPKLTDSMMTIFDKILEVLDIIARLAKQDLRNDGFTRAAQVESNLYNGVLGKKCYICKYKTKHEIQQHKQGTQHVVTKQMSEIIVTVKNAVKHEDVEKISQLVKKYEYKLKLEANTEVDWVCAVCDIICDSSPNYHKHLQDKAHDLCVGSMQVLVTSLKYLETMLQRDARKSVSPQKTAAPSSTSGQVQELPYLSLKARRQKILTYNFGNRYCLVCCVRVHIGEKQLKKHVEFNLHKKMLHIFSRLVEMCDVIEGFSQASTRTGSQKAADDIATALRNKETEKENCAICKTQDLKCDKDYRTHIMHQRIQYGCKTVVMVMEAVRNRDMKRVRNWLQKQRECMKEITSDAQNVKKWICKICIRQFITEQAYGYHVNSSTHISTRVCMNAIVKSVDSFYKSEDAQRWKSEQENNAVSGREAKAKDFTPHAKESTPGNNKDKSETAEHSGDSSIPPVSGNKEKDIAVAKETDTVAMEEMDDGAHSDMGDRHEKHGGEDDDDYDYDDKSGESDGYDVGDEEFAEEEGGDVTEEDVEESNLGDEYKGEDNDKDAKSENQRREEDGDEREQSENIDEKVEFAGGDSALDVEDDEKDGEEVEGMDMEMGSDVDEEALLLDSDGDNQEAELEEEEYEEQGHGSEEEVVSTEGNEEGEKKADEEEVEEAEVEGDEEEQHEEGVAVNDDDDGVDIEDDREIATQEDEEIESEKQEMESDAEKGEEEEKEDERKEEEDGGDDKEIESEEQEMKSDGVEGKEGEEKEDKRKEEEDGDDEGVKVEDNSDCDDENGDYENTDDKEQNEEDDREVVDGEIDNAALVDDGDKDEEDIDEEEEDKEIEEEEGKQEEEEEAAEEEEVEAEEGEQEVEEQEEVEEDGEQDIEENEVGEELEEEEVLQEEVTEEEEKHEIEEEVVEEEQEEEIEEEEGEQEVEKEEVLEEEEVEVEVKEKEEQQSEGSEHPVDMISKGDICSENTMKLGSDERVLSTTEDGTCVRNAQVPATVKENNIQSDDNECKSDEIGSDDQKDEEEKEDSKNKISEASESCVSGNEEYLGEPPFDESTLLTLDETGDDYDDNDEPNMSGDEERTDFDAMMESFIVTDEVGDDN
ncbi:uncharacterized protein [Ptychodera flava]|uniref:uncharacterized protein isoform X2 n=1 Tax=Ptychodera flava TaxID=63121 RepID=UPI00396A7D69